MIKDAIANSFLGVESASPKDASAFRFRRNPSAKGQGTSHRGVPDVNVLYHSLSQGDVNTNPHGIQRKITNSYLFATHGAGDTLPHVVGNDPFQIGRLWRDHTSN